MGPALFISSLASGSKLTMKDIVGNLYFLLRGKNKKKRRKESKTRFQPQTMSDFREGIGVQVGSVLGLEKQQHIKDSLN